MLKDCGIVDMLLGNMAYIALWHWLCFLLCISINTSFFNENRKFYKAYDFEKNGKLYVDKFKIKKWKDILPQHIGKGGFSKKHLSSTSKEYIDYFIMETCRGEWDHRMNCLYFIVSLTVNPILPGIIISTLVILFNIPFIIIQRYNRFRLQKLRNYVVKKQRDLDKSDYVSDL